MQCEHGVEHGGINMCSKCAERYTVKALSQPADDWRSRTCGDCGYAHCFKGQNGSELFICRKNDWMSGDQWGLPMPACPAFVVREVKHAASIAAGKE